MKFAGVIPLLQSPFLESGALDLPSIGAQIDFLAAAGIEAVAFPGFVSEWWKLSGDEIAMAAAAVCQAASGRVQTILNVTAQSSYLAVEQAKHFAALGADGLMCLPPFVMPAGAAAVLSHLEAVMAATPLPNILQYSASLAGIHLSMDQLRQLRHRHSNFTGIKVDFVPPGMMLTELAASFPNDEFTYLIGFAGLQLPDGMKRGAHGLMGGAGHAPEDLAVFRLLRDAPEPAGMRAFHRLLPLLNFEMQTIDQSIATHKWLLHERGVISSAHVRRPGATLDGRQQSELARHLLGCQPAKANA